MLFRSAWRQHPAPLKAANRVCPDTVQEFLKKKTVQASPSCSCGGFWDQEHNYTRLLNTEKIKAEQVVGKETFNYLHSSLVRNVIEEHITVMKRKWCMQHAESCAYCLG